MDCFNDSEEGIVPRKKFRLRWYGNTSFIPKYSFLEVKTTYDNYKTKEVKNFKFESIKKVLDYFNLVYKANLNPMCVVSYQRIYYKNIFNERFTYDYNLEYKDIKSTVSVKSKDTIFEIKFNSNDLKKFSSVIGDKMIRFSKYNDAILKLKEF